MDTDRFPFVFTCIISVLLCVTSASLAALKRSRYLEPYALKDGGKMFTCFELNKPCYVNSECGNFGYYCSGNKTCQCMKQYRANYQSKVCLGGIDQKCQYDEHCIDGAYCMNQSICQCKDSWPYASFDGMECSSGVSKYLPPGIILTVNPLVFLLLFKT